MPEATSSGEPDAGNPHVRFDEGRGTKVPSYSTGSVSALIVYIHIQSRDRESP